MRIRRHRESQQRSRVWLAEEINVHVNTLARWEQNGVSPNHRKLWHIAEALDCRINDLAGSNDRPDIVRCWRCGRPPGRRCVNLYCQRFLWALATEHDADG